MNSISAHNESELTIGFYTKSFLLSQLNLYRYEKKVPLLGTLVSAPLQIALGSIQLISGICCALIFGPLALLSSEATRKAKCSLINIAAGGLLLGVDVLRLLSLGAIDISRKEVISELL